tara:strand:- start:566 stop:1480 length:915 start_codon:yes stop_codon:yes gene_type:complete
MTTPTFTNKRYYKVLVHGIQSSGSVETGLQVNSVTGGGKYASRLSVDGGTERTAINANYIADGWFSDPNEYISEINIANLAGKEKLIIGHTGGANTAGAGTAPKRMEWVGKFVPSPDVDVSSILITGSGTFAVGSEIVVLGWDPADTHTTNFWEELDDSSWSTGGSWTSGTFTSKKYLYVQFYTEGGAGSSYFRFNGDSGSNYANRYSINGGADSTITGQPESYLGAIDGLSFHNLLIINNASNEKLFKHNRVSRSTAGASNSPKRMESVGKWANTSNQITSITVTTAGGGNFTAGNMKVWGHD